ncbi:MAG: hypothetical protein ACJATA_000495 [Sphingobacteriales bacterium]|jgi:hypothetical protein
MKKILLLALVAISGLSFGQTVAIEIFDFSGDSHNAGDNSAITATPSGFAESCAVTYEWTITPLTYTFPTIGGATNAGPHPGTFNAAASYTVSVIATGNGLGCGAQSEGQEAISSETIQIFEEGTPVVIASQSAIIKKGVTQLSWSTFSEFNNDFFLIKRSSDGFNFEEIGSVVGKGNTKITQYYSFEDMNPLAGVSYYQIVQFDMDGSSIALSALPVKYLKNNLNVVKLSPNPVNVTSVIDFEAAFEGGVELKVFDLMGRSVISQLVPVEKGLNSVNLDMSFLSNGLYQVSLTDGVNNVIEKIYKN